MNMNKNPTIDQLRGLIAACDDARSHHVMWIAADGEVQIEPLPASLNPVGLEEVKGKAMKYRYETFVVGNGYVGTTAAADARHVKGLFEELKSAWGGQGTGDGWVGGTHGG